VERVARVDLQQLAADAPVAPAVHADRLDPVPGDGVPAGETGDDADPVRPGGQPYRHHQVADRPADQAGGGQQREDQPDRIPVAEEQAGGADQYGDRDLARRDLAGDPPGQLRGFAGFAVHRSRMAVHRPRLPVAWRGCRSRESRRTIRETRVTRE